MRAGRSGPAFENQDVPLAPTWKPDYPPSGDCIGECLENHSLEEALLLASRMRDKFDQGLAILSGLRQDYKNEPERLLDIGVAEALAIQFRSARNIFEFYWLRRELFSTADGKLAKTTVLAKLKALVLAEIENSSQLALLCAEDSRLGFHSEAEAHQYFGERLHWRIKFLQDLLDQDFVEFAAAIENDSALPQSQFQLDCPRYKLNSAWYGDEHNQWRLDRLQDGGLQLEFRGLDLELENESVGFNCVDAYGCTFPLMLTVSKTPRFPASSLGGMRGGTRGATLACPHKAALSYMEQRCEAAAALHLSVPCRPQRRGRDAHSAL